MSEDQALGAVYGALVLILVGSNLVVRRLSINRFIHMALAWAAIFVASLFLVWFLGLDAQ